MKRNGIYVVDSFAEAFSMKVVRLVMTADSMRWARAASDSMTGVSVLVFSMSSTLGKQLVNRVGQCVMTSPTSGLRHHEA